MGVQVPPRTERPGKFPATQTPLDHAARPPAGQAALVPPRAEAAMTAPLIAPLIPPRARQGTREHGRPTTARRLPMAAVPKVPAVPGDVVYGTGRIDESGRGGGPALHGVLGRPG